VKTISANFRLVALVTCLLLASSAAVAQDKNAQEQVAHAQHATVAAMQSASTALANLPDADILIYVSPQRLLNDAVPKFLSPKDLSGMREGFAELKKNVGIDPATVEYLIIAMRFHKPAGDLSFVAPDVLTVVGGDFNPDSLLTLGQQALGDKVHTEKHGTKTIAFMTVDEIATEAAKNPMLKSLTEIGAVALSPNSLAIGNVPYLKAAIDAADGTGRINPATLQSLMRDPNVLMAATGTPISSIAKAFGLFGTETTPRDNRCDTSFGNFYSAVTIDGTNIRLRGAMNADNPDTAKIISNLLAALMQQGIDSVPDKEVQSVLHTIKMTPQDNEIIWDADIPEKVIADLLKPKSEASSSSTIKTTAPPRRPIRRKRPR
jgi:hypothetical protein